MSFHDYSLPDGFQYGSTFGAGFNTVVQTTATGHEYRLARQSQARHRYRLMAGLRTQAEAMALKTFAMARRGSLHSFRLKDWIDYTSNDDGTTAASNLDQIIGIGDGTTTQFQLIKTYDETGPAPYVRTIELPVAGTVVAADDGVGTSSWTLSNPGGVLTFAAAPTAGHVITAGYQFNVPVRFESAMDQWAEMRADAFSVWTLEQMQCVEVLGEIEWPELWNPGGCIAHGAVSQDLTISYAQGLLHTIAPSAAINMFLPAPYRAVGGPRHFVISVTTGSAGTVQIRDDSGNTVGSAVAAGSVVQLGLVVSGGTATWVRY